MERIERTSSLTLIIILCFIGLMLYGKATLNGFVWDDSLQIQNNAYIQHISSLPQLFLGSTFNYPGTKMLGGIYYKPLMTMAFTLVYSIWQLNPFGYHLMDALLHIVNVLLVFFLFKKLFSLEGFKYSKSIAFFVSLIFLVHPANVEAVAYISSTQEVLYVFFLLVSLLLTVAYCTKKPSRFVFFLIQFSILLSLLSKESGILSMFFCNLLVFIFWRKFFKRFLLISFFTLSVYTFLRVVLAHITVLTNSILVPIQSASFQQRFLTIPYEIYSYVRLFFFPLNLYIAQDNVIRTASDTRFIIGMLTTFLLAVIMYYAVRKIKSKLLYFFSIWIVVGFGMVLNIIPLDMTVAERWMYGPIIGCLGFLAIIINYLHKNMPRIAKSLVLITLCILPVFFVMSFIRIGDWHDEISLFSHDILFEKESYSLYNEYAGALLIQKDYAQSKKYYEKSILMNPFQSVGYDGLGSAYYFEGDYQKALYYMGIAVVHDGSGIAYEHYALTLQKLNAPLATQERFLLQAISYYPDYALLHSLLSEVYSKEGKIKEAQSEKLKADRINALNSPSGNYLQIPN